jgi:hypothetical protein
VTIVRTITGQDKGMYGMTIRHLDNRTIKIEKTMKGRYNRRTRQ